MLFVILPLFRKVYLQARRKRRPRFYAQQSRTRTNASLKPREKSAELRFAVPSRGLESSWRLIAFVRSVICRVSRFTAFSQLQRHLRQTGSVKIESPRAVCAVLSRNLDRYIVFDTPVFPFSDYG